MSRRHSGHNVDCGSRHPAPSVDYIVVGAGTAGCVLANRLTESGKYNVLLLEAGGRDSHFWLRVPLGIGKIRGDARYHWKFFTEPEQHMAGQRVYWPRGRVLGGSGSVNGMIFNRSQPADFDEWRALGNEGWDFDSLLPYFRKLETYPDGDTEWRGKDGPIHVTNLERDRDPLSDAFIAASVQAGYPRISDYNAGANDAGTSYLQLNIRNGIRCSPATAYLRPASRRPNLQIETNAQATRVLFENKRAIGIEYQVGGERRTVLCGREVILSAGVIQSPQLLELSGVGNPRLLTGMGIPVVQDLSGVGENLQDHMQVRIVFECTRPLTLNAVLANPLRQAAMGLRFLLLRKGLMTTASAKTFTNVRALPASPRADVKIQQYMISGDSRQPGGTDFQIDKFWGFSIGHNQMRPESRGSIHIGSADPLAPPKIVVNYLAEEVDKRTHVAAIRVSRNIASQPALAAFIRKECRPGLDVTTDDELLAYCGETGHTSYHPAGTCKMGHDKMAVVDERLRVRQLAGLRVVDASIMPALTSCNTNVPTFMIAEKAAAMILEDAARTNDAPGPKA